MLAPGALVKLCGCDYNSGLFDAMCYLQGLSCSWPLMHPASSAGRTFQSVQRLKCSSSWRTPQSSMPAASDVCCSSTSLKVHLRGCRQCLKFAFAAFIRHMCASRMCGCTECPGLMMMGLSVACKQMTRSAWRGLDLSCANLLNTSHLGTFKPKFIEV